MREARYIVLIGHPGEDERLCVYGLFLRKGRIDDDKVGAEGGGSCGDQADAGMVTSDK